MSSDKITITLGFFPFAFCDMALLDTANKAKQITIPAINVYRRLEVARLSLQQRGFIYSIIRLMNRVSIHFSRLQINNGHSF